MGGAKAGFQDPDKSSSAAAACGGEAPSESGGDPGGGPDAGEEKEDDDEVMEEEEVEEEEDADVGEDDDPEDSSKWPLTMLREYFEKTGMDYELVMRRIKDLVVKTMISVEPVIVSTWHRGANFQGTSFDAPPNAAGDAGAAGGQGSWPSQTCFEIYGFDVMLDEKLKPWLLEVNISPSLSSSSPLDKRIKTQLIADTLTLIGFRPFDYRLVAQEMREERISRLLGLTSSANRSPFRRKIGGTGAPTPENMVRHFGEMEWQLILDTHDEHMRRGTLERIYPTRTSLDAYADYFQTQRYSNVVLSNWLKVGGESCFSANARKSGGIPDWVPKQNCFSEC